MSATVGDFCCTKCGKVLAILRWEGGHRKIVLPCGASCGCGNELVIDFEGASKMLGKVPELDTDGVLYAQGPKRVQ